MKTAIAETTEFRCIEGVVQDMVGATDMPETCCRLIGD